MAFSLTRAAQRGSHPIHAWTPALLCATQCLRRRGQVDRPGLLALRWRDAPWRAVGDTPPPKLAARELRLMANTVDRWATERTDGDECARLLRAAELLREAAGELTAAPDAKT
jgi:hypothetical protein